MPTPPWSASVRGMNRRQPPTSRQDTTNQADWRTSSVPSISQQCVERHCQPFCISQHLSDAKGLTLGWGPCSIKGQLRSFIIVLSSCPMAILDHRFSTVCCGHALLGHWGEGLGRYRWTIWTQCLPKQLYAPESFRSGVLKWGHSFPNPIGGLLLQRFWWPSLDDDVQDFVKACSSCNLHKQVSLQLGSLIHCQFLVGPGPTSPWTFSPDCLAQPGTLWYSP